MGTRFFGSAGGRPRNREFRCVPLWPTANAGVSPLGPIANAGVSPFGRARLLPSREFSRASAGAFQPELTAGWWYGSQIDRLSGSFALPNGIAGVSPLGSTTLMNGVARDNQAVRIKSCSGLRRRSANQRIAIKIRARSLPNGLHRSEVNGA